MVNRACPKPFRFHVDITQILADESQDRTIAKLSVAQPKVAVNPSIPHPLRPISNRWLQSDGYFTGSLYNDYVPGIQDPMAFRFGLVINFLRLDTNWQQTRVGN